MKRLILVPVCALLLALPACSDSSSKDEEETDDGGFGSDDPDGGAGEDSLEWNGCTTTVTYTGDEYRTYNFETSCSLLNDVPESGELQVEEEEGQVVSRTSDTMFDALFALAMQEVRDATVECIQDGAFNDGNAVDCSCFETGAEWHYVWTRDTAYAAQLGLAAVEPERTARSLSFKLSDRKAAAGGGQAEIVQDTGSGGSWPVSTDRVVWALGAWEALKFLDGTERQEFFDAAYEAVVNTVERDREAVYDSRDGLYRGEQSFLDWREQTYPTWTADTTVHQGMSKALSTNAGHRAILTIASQMATEAGDTTAATRYSGWAEDLAQAINDELWLSDHGLYSTLKATELDDAPLAKFDLLGEALAVLCDVASEDRAEIIVASYPHTVAGPPVIWPQNPATPIYHNRGIWPFVTAYGVRAAAKAGNAEVVKRGVDSLMIGAATNLSNMENFEFMTLSNHVEDGDLTGPVINSRRQLWSVGGYLSMVIHTLFGIHADQDGLSFEPFLPAARARGDVLRRGRDHPQGLPLQGKEDRRGHRPRRFGGHDGRILDRRLCDPERGAPGGGRGVVGRAPGRRRCSGGAGGSRGLERRGDAGGGRGRFHRLLRAEGAAAQRAELERRIAGALLGRQRRDRRGLQRVQERRARRRAGSTGHRGRIRTGRRRPRGPRATASRRSTRGRARPRTTQSPSVGGESPTSGSFSTRRTP